MNNTSFAENIEQRIYMMKEGEAFGLGDLSDCGTYDSIRKELSRLCAQRRITRLLKGIYCLGPEGLCELPSVFDVAQAIARNNNWSTIWGTEHARVLLGLSNASQYTYTFRSTGQTARFMYRGTSIVFQSTNPDIILSMRPKSALVTSALMDLRTHKITPFEIQQLSQALTTEEKCALLEDRIYAPARLRCVFEIICGEYGLTGR